MSKQPPPPSAEAIRLAEQRNKYSIDTVAYGIDTLCEQRVEAERERSQRVITAARIMCHEYSGPEEGMAASDLRQAVIAYDKIRAPAERPAPEGPPPDVWTEEEIRAANAVAEVWASRFKQQDSSRGVGVEQPTQETRQPGCGEALKHAERG